MAVGELIRGLRSARCWSQGRLAAEVCKAAERDTVTRETVSRWETSKIDCPAPFWLRHLAAVLQVPLQVLENERLDRRRFITEVAAAAVAPIIAADLIYSGFAAALDGRGPDIDAWQEKLFAYGQDYMSLGAEEIQKRLAADLLVVQQQLDTPALWDVSAKLMMLYGKTFPGGDGAKALRWYRSAAEAADRSDNDDTRVWVRGRAAIALGYEGASLGMAEIFAEQAASISEKPSLGRLNAVMGMAHVAALRGDRATALEMLDEGRRLFDTAGSDEQASDYAVPEWRMNVFCSLLLARLGEERQAGEAQDAAATSLPASLPRFATHLELHRGLMLAKAGDRTGGVAHARAALDQLPADKHSLTLRMLMAEIEAVA